MILGDIIRKYRDENKCSMDDFAKKCGLSKAYISILERNRNPVNGKTVVPSLETIKAVSAAVDLDFNDVIAMLDSKQKISLLPDKPEADRHRKKGVKVPVLGCVAAGIPIDAVEDIVDYEEITEKMAATGDFFGLQIKGASMEPRMVDGDVVIVRKQPDVENGETAIVLVDGCNATCKKILHNNDGIMLIGTNPNFEPMFYNNQDIQELPVTIIGRVVELRAKI